MILQCSQDKSKSFYIAFHHLSSVYLSSLTFHHPSHKEPYVLFFPITHTSLCFTELIYIFLCTDVAHLFSHLPLDLFQLPCFLPCFFPLLFFLNFLFFSSPDLPTSLNMPDPLSLLLIVPFKI